MASNSIKKKKAGDITKIFLDEYPNLKTFLQILLKDIEIEMKKVGRPFQYPPSIRMYNLYLSNGLVMDYFIRKLLSNRFSVKLEDNATEVVLNNERRYFTFKAESIISPEDIKKHYMVYKDPNSRAMDIVESIKIVSISKTLHYRDPLPKAEVETNYDNLIEIKKYFENLPYSRVEFKPNVGCEYFEANADIIFEQDILYEIKTSKRTSTPVNRNVLYKLVLYAFGYYKTTGKMINNFKIYNPLLGQEHQFKINDIDMIHFEEVLKKDMGNLKIARKK